jgi:hypothetical protein
MRTIFGKFIESYGKYYGLNEHLAIDETIVLYNVRVIFKQYISKTQMVWDKNLQAL